MADELALTDLRRIRDSLEENRERDAADTFLAWDGHYYAYRAPQMRLVKIGYFVYWTPQVVFYREYVMEGG